jgi:hypothetical protein
MICHVLASTHLVELGGIEMLRRLTTVILLALCASLFAPTTAHAVSQEKALILPADKGRLEARVWRQSGNGTISGNTLQWDYRVTAYYSGPKAVDWIQVNWYGGASLRNGASVSIGIGRDSASVGTSSSWQQGRTETLHWTNTQGQKISDYSQTMVVAPRQDYQADSIYTVSIAKLKLIGDAKVYATSASV